MITLILEYCIMTVFVMQTVPKRHFPIKKQSLTNNLYLIDAKITLNCHSTLFKEQAYIVLEID